MALFLALEIFGIKKKDEIIFPELTNNVFNREILKMGIRPKFVEIDNQNCCLSINSLKKILNKKTKVVICENLFGEMPNIIEIKKICKKNNTFLIEDISDAIGLKNTNNLTGKFGDITICNFSIDKIITSGEGGAILTDNKGIYSKAKDIRDNKIINNYKQSMNNSNLYFTPSNLQSAMIYGQFKRLNELVEIKKKILNYYKRNLSELSITLRGLTYIIVEFNEKYRVNPSMLIKFLKKNKIHAKRLPEPLTSKIKNNKKNSSFSSKFYKNSIILPSNYSLNSQDINFISNKIKFFLGK